MIHYGEWVKVGIVVFWVLEMVQVNSMVQDEDDQHQSSRRIHYRSLRISIIMGRVHWAMIVTTGTSTKGLPSRELLVRTAMGMRSRGFGYFPLGAISEVIVIIW